LGGGAQKKTRLRGGENVAKFFSNHPKHQGGRKKNKKKNPPRFAEFWGGGGGVFLGKNTERGPPKTEKERGNPCPVGGGALKTQKQPTVEPAF